MVSGCLDLHTCSTLTCLFQILARLEDYERVMAVNAQGLFLCYKYAALKMVEQGRGGRIIGMHFNLVVL